VSKKKRVRRDIEKFSRVGRYWDLLRLLEDEGQVSAHAKEHQQAWKAVIKQALQQERGFTQFCREVGTLKGFPNEPDFRFLMRIRGFIEGRSSAEEVLELKGLTPDAEKLRSNFAACAASSMHQEKLGALLKKFLHEPDKITRRYFEQVAELVPVSSLGVSVNRVGESIALARRLNQKAAVARGWDGIDSNRLARLDGHLLRASQSLPQALTEVLLHPLVHNLAVMCRRLAPEASSNRAAQLVRAIPFLLPRLAGEKFQEVESKLLINRGEWVKGSASDLKALQQKVEGLSIEEKVILLNGLRLRVQNRPSRKPGFEDLDFFDDDDDNDTDEFLEEEKSAEVDLAQALLLLHRSVLTDISRRLPELSLRDRKELVRVMEPILFHDLDYILDAMEDADDLLSLLDAAIGAGCAGTRMGLLAVLAGAFYRNGDLRKRADKLLDQSPAPTLQDMEWLAREWSEFYSPSARSLKPLMVRYQNEKALLAVFAAQLCSLAEFDLVESMLKTDLLRLPVALLKLIGLPKAEEPGILRRELEALSEYAVLDSARHFLRCYADDRLTRDGHLCWLNALHSLQPEEVWGVALAELRRYRDIDARGHNLLPLKALHTLFADKVEAAMLFMQEHLDELVTLSMDTLAPLLEEVLERSRILPAHQTLLIRLEKLCAERVAAGGPAARMVMEKIRQTLQELARPDKKTRKPRKSKR
jgi:hypothetical protein